MLKYVCRLPVLPVEILKAATVHRWHMSRKVGEARNNDLRALRTMAAVCHYWRCVIATVSKISRRQLKQLLHC